MAGPIIAKEVLVTQCMEFCQQLMTKETSFSFSLSLGSSFCFSLDTKESASLDSKRAASSGLPGTRKKLSPSSLRRNIRRRQEFLLKKLGVDKSSADTAAAEKATAEKADAKKVVTGNTAAEEAAIEEAFVEEAVVQKDAVESLLTSCCFCKLSNKTSRALRLHKKFSHRKELREFEEEHRETTGQSVTSTKLVCEKCNFAAENSESLRTHSRQKHRVFDCELCAFSSSSENGLNIHITKAHSKFQEEGKVCEIEQRYNESWYLCNICDNPCNFASAFECKHPWKMSDHFIEQHSYMSQNISQEQKSFLEKLDKTVLPGWAPR